MGKLSDEILKDLQKRKGKSADEEDPEDMADGGSDDAEEGDEPASDEETAMEEFTNAKTPAEKVTAMKSFLKICYPNLGE